MLARVRNLWYGLLILGGLGMQANEVDRTDDEYCTIKIACERLGVSPNTLRSWGASGKVTEYRHPLNNYRLYRRVDIEDLRNRLMHPAPTEKGKNK